MIADAGCLPMDNRTVNSKWHRKQAVKIQRRDNRSTGLQQHVSKKFGFKGGRDAIVCAGSSN